MDKSKIPFVKFGCCGNIFVKMIHFHKQGDFEQQHKHEYDHMSMLSKGSVKVTVNGEETVFVAPHLVYISKQENHRIEALEDDTIWLCIHAIRNAENFDIIPEDMVPLGVTNAYYHVTKMEENGEIAFMGSCCGDDLTPEQLEYLHYVNERDYQGAINGDIPVTKPSET